MGLRALVLVMCVLLGGSVIAQKGKSKNDRVDKPELTEERLLKAETTFIEAEKQIILENYEKAFELLMATRDLNPDNATVYFKLAEVVVKIGQNERGLEYINQAIERDSQNKYFYVFKAEILKAINQLDEAAATYELLIERIPGTNEYLFDLAAIYQYMGDYENALRAYNMAEDRYGLSESIVREKQQIYLKSNNLEQLIADWDELIAENPDRIDFSIELCTILLANGMLKEAEERLYPLYKSTENASAAFLIADIERQKGNIDEALRFMKIGIAGEDVVVIAKISLLSNYLSIADDGYLEQLESLLQELIITHPNEYEAIAFVGDAYMRLGKNELALDYYRRASKSNAASFSVWQQIVGMEYEQGLYDSVVVHCDDALELFPNQAVFYFYNGAALYIQKNYERSARTLERGVKYATDGNLLTLFYGQLGDAYNGLKDNVKSDDSYEKALENDPSNDHVLNNYSYFLSLRGEKLDRAFEMSAKLVASYPENATYLDTHGWVLYVMGKYKEAEIHLRKASQIEQDGTIIEHYGDVLFKMGQEADALVQWKRAKELGGTTEEIDRKIEDRMLYE